MKRSNRNPSELPKGFLNFTRGIASLSEGTFRRTLPMSSPGNAFGANVPFNAERNAGSVGSFGVTSTPEMYTSPDDVSAGADMPNDRDPRDPREPIYINRSYHVLSLLFSLSPVLSLMFSLLSLSSHCILSPLSPLSPLSLHSLSSLSPVLSLLF